MATYVYASTKTLGAMELVKALGYPRLRKFDGLDFWDRSKRFSLDPGDAVICWGTQLGDLDGIKILNGGPFPQNKFKLFSTLTNAGLYSVTAYAHNMLNWKKAPNKYLPRLIHARHGSDLIKPPDYADYLVVREKIQNEYRLHSFCGKIIRAGVKVPREGFELAQEGEWRSGANLAHPWVRTFETGWRVKYEGFETTELQRRLANSAIAVLGLNFGVVDLGVCVNELDGGTAVKVLDVYQTPILDEVTTKLYADAIREWVAPVQQDGIKAKTVELKRQLREKRIERKRLNAEARPLVGDWYVGAGHIANIPIAPQVRPEPDVAVNPGPNPQRNEELQRQLRRYQDLLVGYHGVVRGNDPEGGQ